MNREKLEQGGAVPICTGGTGRKPKQSVVLRSMRLEARGSGKGKLPHELASAYSSFCMGPFTKGSVFSVFHLSYFHNI